VKRKVDSGRKPFYLLVEAELFKRFVRFRDEDQQVTTRSLKKEDEKIAAASDFFIRVGRQLETSEVIAVNTASAKTPDLPLCWL